MSEQPEFTGLVGEDGQLHDYVRAAAEGRRTSWGIEGIREDFRLLATAHFGLPVTGHFVGEDGRDELTPEQQRQILDAYDAPDWLFAEPDEQRQVFDMELSARGRISTGVELVSDQPADILDSIDNALGCQRCGRPLGASPSDDFCSPECLRAWHAQHAVPLPPSLDAAYVYPENDSARVPLNEDVPEGGDPWQPFDVPEGVDWHQAAIAALDRIPQTYRIEHSHDDSSDHTDIRPTAWPDRATIAAAERLAWQRAHAEGAAGIPVYWPSLPGVRRLWNLITGERQ